MAAVTPDLPHTCVRTYTFQADRVGCAHASISCVHLSKSIPSGEAVPMPSMEVNGVLSRVPPTPWTHTWPPPLFHAVLGGEVEAQPRPAGFIFSSTVDHRHC
jgi:hypothetical protein